MTFQNASEKTPELLIHENLDDKVGHEVLLGSQEASILLKTPKKVKIFAKKAEKL